MMLKRLFVFLFLPMVLLACQKKKSPIEQKKETILIEVQALGGGKVLLNNQVCKSENSPCLLEVEKGGLSELSVYPTSDVYFMRWENCASAVGTTCTERFFEKKSVVAHFTKMPPKTQCEKNETLYLGYCYLTFKACLLPGGILGQSTFSMGEYGTCEAKTCQDLNSHLENGVCVLNTQPCEDPLQNGYGQKIYQGNSSYTQCRITSCYKDYAFKSDEQKCVPKLASCTDSFLNVGNKTFDETLQTYGACQITSCALSSQHVETLSGLNFCLSNQKSCPLPDNALSCNLYWNVILGAWGSPVVTCKNNFFVSGGTCLPQALDGSQSEISVLSKDGALILTSSQTLKNTVAVNVKSGGPFVVRILAKDSSGNLLNNLSNLKLGLKLEVPSDADPLYATSPTFKGQGVYEMLADTLDSGLYRVFLAQETLQGTIDFSSQFSKMAVEMDYCLKAPDPETFPLHGKQIYNRAPYQNVEFLTICTAEELASLGRLYPDSGKISATDRLKANIRLKQDIDLNDYYSSGGKEFMIGSMGSSFGGNQPFTGLFSGENHTIKNFKISNSANLFDDPGGTDYPSLVGFIPLYFPEKAVQGIKNLSLKNFFLNLTQNQRAYYLPYAAGGLIGQAFPDQEARTLNIENVFVSGKILINSSGYSASAIGGVLGEVNGAINSGSQVPKSMIQILNVESQVDMWPQSLASYFTSRINYGGLFGHMRLNPYGYVSEVQALVKNVKLKGSIGDEQIVASSVAGIGTLTKDFYAKTKVDFENLYVEETLKGSGVLLGALDLLGDAGSLIYSNSYFLSAPLSQTGYDFTPWFYFKNALFINTLKSQNTLPEQMGLFTNPFICFQDSSCPMYKIFGDKTSGFAYDCSQFENVFLNSSQTYSSNQAIDPLLGLNINCPGLSKTSKTAADFGPQAPPLSGFQLSSLWAFFSSLPYLALGL